MGNLGMSAASTWLFVASLLLCHGCATMRPLAWPGPPPHAVALRLTGPDAADSRQALCEQIAMDAGAVVSERAPVVATLELGAQNRLIIATGQKVIYNEPRPHWMTRQLCEQAPPDL